MNKTYEIASWIADELIEEMLDETREIENMLEQEKDRFENMIEVVYKIKKEFICLEQVRVIELMINGDKK